MFHATLFIISRTYFFGFSKSAPTPRYTILDSMLLLVMRSRKVGLPFATRARKRELSIRQVRIENESDRKFLKSIFFEVFLKTTFLHVSCYPVHYQPKIFVWISKSAPTPRYTILDSWLLLVMRSRKAGLPFATRARKRELSIRQVRIENESDRKFLKSNFFRSFSENHFPPRFMLPCSLLAEIFFGFSKSCEKNWFLGIRVKM